MQNKRLWIIVTILSVMVVCWGVGWVFLQPPSPAQPIDSLQAVIMEHIEYLPEVFRAHESYNGQLHNDSNAIFIYRYSPSMCAPCYLEDLLELDEFSKTIDRSRILVLPAYSTNDRSSRARIFSETRGLALMLHIIPMSRFIITADRYVYFASAGFFS